MTQEQFIDKFALCDSEWAQEWIEDNGSINTIDKLKTFLKETYNDPFEYLFEVMTQEIDLVESV